MEMLGISAVTSIVIICYLVGLGIKGTPYDNNNTIPLCCGLVGGFIGLMGFLFWRESYPYGEPITAFAVGVVSGLSATGLDQVQRQLFPNGKIEEGEP